MGQTSHEAWPVWAVGRYHVRLRDEGVLIGLGRRGLADKKGAIVGLISEAAVEPSAELKVAEKSPPMRTWASCAILQLLSAMVRATLATMPERFLPRKEMENFCTVSAQYGEMLLFGAHSRDGGAALAI